MTPVVTVVGGGLAGSEAAWQLANRDIHVKLYEMRPARPTPAHGSDRLAELVCSNSMGSTLPDRALGILKQEMLGLGSMIIATAFKHALPAGSALAVSRDDFAEEVTARIRAHPNIQVLREEVTAIPAGPTILATGPLTSDALTAQIQALTGQRYLYFYDAMAPIVSGESVDTSIAFRASRYGQAEGEGDYLNCPLNREEYERFVQELLAAETNPLRDFEREDPHFFEACLPVEVLARRGPRALAYGPLKPVGLTDPRTGRWPHAVVQLRQDNQAASLYNMVGFQTNLKWGEQERVFRLIPGLAGAEFVRYGQMHRNTYINAPAMLRPTLQLRQRPDLLFAGQISGTEGYIGSVASGLVAGLNAARLATGREPLAPPPETMTGALCHYVAGADPGGFQPMKANFGLLPPLDPPVRNKRARYQAYARRALEALERYAAEAGPVLSSACQ